MIQRCRCTKCRQPFSVRYSKRATFWQVFDKIVAGHLKVSPACARKNGLERVRLLPPE